MNEIPPVLSVRNLSKSFDGLPVIRDLSFSLAPGAFEAVMGPSGSGKSTFLHLVAGLLAPDAGTISVAGVDMATASDDERTLFRRRNLGLVFQDFNLLPTLTAEENIALPFLLDRRPVDAKRIAWLLDFFGLAARRRHLPHALSGGERQRVAIARALAMSPSLLLADEPTGNLDSANARNFCGLLARLHAETDLSILLVTHDLIAASATDRIHLLRDGAFVESFVPSGDRELAARRYLAAMGA
ncbi:MAG: ABC transporter ATP-binding protein [Kiritimatiellae bacterium]|nr:ABC transporter ATP-binding protein [Kiritimatiellia bacterium]